MKVNQKKIFIILFSALATAGCVPVGKKFAIEFKDPSAFTNLKLDVSSVQVQNNQLIVHGSGLKDIKTIKLVNNGVTETLVVESATSGELVANGLSAVAIGVEKIFDMVLADAYGSATVPVTFTLEHGSITAAHLSNMGAVSGQVLKYNGTHWEPSTLSSSQVYQGVWNANANTPNLNLTSPVSGEYYIVTVAGTYNAVAFDVGDWIIHNGTSWDKVVSSAANKLSLSGGTLTGNLQLDTLLKFKGAANYVTLKASSSLASDIILTLPKTLGTSGQFLTTDGTGVMSWTTPADPVIGNLDASQIADGSVTNTAFQYLAGATSNIQAQLNAKQATGNFVTALTGDVTASGAGSVAATVATVGGATAANIAAGTMLANAATDANTASAIIKRDSSGNFSAGTITGTINGNATNVTGTVAVANGGTGNTTLGVNQLLFGNGTSAINGLPITAIPAVLLSTVASGAPAWTTTTSGNVLKGSVSGVGFGALVSSDLPAGTLSGAGTANYVPYYNTANTLANSPMAISGNNVGLGTLSPGALLHLGTGTPVNPLSSLNNGLFVSGNIEIGGTFYLPTSGFADYSSSGLVLRTTTNSAIPAFYIKGKDSAGTIATGFDLTSSWINATPGSLKSRTIFNTHDTAAREAIRLESDGASSHVGIGGAAHSNNMLTVNGQSYFTGNVGIGTSAPGGPLHIYTNSANSLIFERTAAFNANIQYKNTVGSIYAGLSPAANFGVGIAADLSTAFFTVTNTGNVGIGTTTPVASLQIFNGSPTPGTTTAILSNGIGNTAFLLSAKKGVATNNTGDVMTAFGLNYNNAIENANIKFHRGPTTTGGFMSFTTNTDIERMRIDTSGNVGIGTTSPTTALQVVGDISNNGNISITNNGLINMSQNAYGDKWYFAGSGMKMSMDAASTSWQTSIGGSTTLTKYRWSTTKAGSINGPILDLGLDGNALFYGNVGIGTTTPSTPLHVNTTTAGATVATFQSGTGSCTVVPNSGMSCSSDIRLKENVEEIMNGLDKVLHLRGVTFQWKERSAADDSRHMGFIAQEVEKVAPELVSKDTRGYKQVNYANFVAVLTEAVKELFHKWSNDSQGLHREIASVKAESAQLKKDNESLKLENKAIKSYLCHKDPNAEICQ